ncbi:PadR family transcriptional regulator [Caproicibacter sp.]|uniref:PadR family transcriptional regulator n=1 Tax=Caproicibacter sp. TaxID=2814884 RepID=UPI00398A42D0
MHESYQNGALTEITFYILLSTFQPNHGYGIMQTIETETQGRLVPGAGTLYGALRVLTKKGWIAPCGKTENGRGQLYLITEQGKQAVAKETSRINRLLQTAKRLTTGGNLY